MMYALSPMSSLATRFMIRLYFAVGGRHVFRIHELATATTNNHSNSRFRAAMLAQFLADRTATQYDRLFA